MLADIVLLCVQVPIEAGRLSGGEQNWLNILYPIKVSIVAKLETVFYDCCCRSER